MPALTVKHLSRLRSRPLLARRAVTAFSAILALGSGAVAAATWVYSRTLVSAPRRQHTSCRRVRFDDNTVVMSPNRRAFADCYGLVLEDGIRLSYSGPVRWRDTQEGPVVIRAIDGTENGDRPPTPTDGHDHNVQFDQYVYTQSPSEVGLEYTTVSIPLNDGIGAAKAWMIHGSGSWIIVVHGRSGTRAESLRILPTLTELGHTVLVISLRNDHDGGPTTDELGYFGTVEHQDVAAAVRFAQQSGAHDITFFAFSQGCAVVAEYLKSSEASRLPLTGAVLDSPLLSLPTTLQTQADRRGIPHWLRPLLLRTLNWMTQLRFGFDLESVEHIDLYAKLPQPLLLIHGEGDNFVPIEPTDRLAERRPDCTYVRLSDTAHVDGWNMHREHYEQAVRQFLIELRRDQPIGHLPPSIDVATDAQVTEPSLKAGAPTSLTHDELELEGSTLVDDG